MHADNADEQNYCLLSNILFACYQSDAILKTMFNITSLLTPMKCFDNSFPFQVNMH